MRIKTIFFFFFCGLFLIACNSIFVIADYNTRIDFNQYKTYAFYKSGIDKVEISELDKQRILESIDHYLQTKDFTKSQTPDLLINIATEDNQDIHVSGNASWYWSPWFWGSPHPYGFYSTVSSRLYIDLIDAETGRLVWQGYGEGRIHHLRGEKKENRINEYVEKILSNFPPNWFYHE
ncbi:MAG: DUF4136 domain-containing protein [Flavobacteriaceae bacterium]|nr:DUF4136 domain-containing protein [Flavobacteriaceae bacterium]